MAVAWRQFGFSGEDFLPRFGQLERHQASADQCGKGQEDGDDLGDADEGGEDEAGDDGGKLANAVEDAERRASAKFRREEESSAQVFAHRLCEMQVRVLSNFSCHFFLSLIFFLSFFSLSLFQERAKILAMVIICTKKQQEARVCLQEKTAVMTWTEFKCGINIHLDF